MLAYLTVSHLIYVDNSFPISASLVWYVRPRHLLMCALIKKIFKWKNYQFMQKHYFKIS